MDEAKETWISKVIKETEHARKDGKQKWMNIRKLQMDYAGRRAAGPTRLYKRDGEMTNGPEEVKATWHQHFTKVLNIPSEYHQDVLNNMPSQPPVMELDHPPTFDELTEALSKTKRRKAGGGQGSCQSCRYMVVPSYRTGCSL